MAQLPRELCTCCNCALQSQEPQILCTHQATHALPSPLVRVPLWVQLLDLLLCRTVGYQDALTRREDVYSCGENAYALANPNNFQSMFKAGQSLHAIVLDSASLLVSI